MLIILKNRRFERKFHRGGTHLMIVSILIGETMIYISRRFHSSRWLVRVWKLETLKIIEIVVSDTLDTRLLNSSAARL